MIDKSEKKIAKKLGGKLTNASGAICDDGDIKLNKEYIIEVKRREITKVIFMTKVWEKLRVQSIKHNKIPIYIFQNAKDKYVFMNIHAYTLQFGNVENITYIQYKGKTNISLDINGGFFVGKFDYDFEKYKGQFIVMTFNNFYSDWRKLHG